MIINLLSYLTAFGLLFLIFFLVFRSFFYRGYLLKKWNKLRKYFLHFALTISLLATFGSLYLSNVLGFNPCPLCWYQRIFMYPIPILIIGSLYFKDNNIARYINPLAVIGLLFSIYHYVVQFSANVACVGDSLDCSIRYIFELGFITIPFMAGTAFLLILLFVNQR